MLKAQGVRWHCADRQCGWSAVLTIYEQGETVPRCVCGAPMTRSELPPVFSYLDFLREEESPRTVDKKEKE